jgi:hypothetical protein
LSNRFVGPAASEVVGAFDHTFDRTFDHAFDRTFDHAFDRTFDHAMVTSLGFGGVNGALWLARVGDRAGYG